MLRSLIHEWNIAYNKWQAFNRHLDHSMLRDLPLRDIIS